MKHKVSELEGALLDAAVAKAEGRTFTLEGYGALAHLAPRTWAEGTTLDESRGDCWAVFEPSSAWADGGPIIERERIATAFLFGEWHGFISSDGGPYDCASSLIEATDSDAQGAGATPLIAAMRAYVASKLGDEIEL